MRILLATPFLPRKDAGHAGGRFVYEVLRYLGGKHEIDLATRIETDELAERELLAGFCRRIFIFPYRSPGRRWFGAKLALIWSYLVFSRSVANILRAGDYDLALVEWTETAILLKRGRVPLILDAHDVISKPAERGMRHSRGIGWAFSWVKYRLVILLERVICCRCDVVMTRSENDAAYLRKMIPAVTSAVIPHPAGLDIGTTRYERKPGTILFLASYRHRVVNVEAALWFYREVFPLVCREVPDARFIVAGYGPPPLLTALAADPAVTVPGFIDDLDRCYKEAAVFVAPILTGGGIIAKVLDSLAAGTPTVSTTFGNEGILAVPGEDILIADAPDEFAAAVVRLLRDREYADTLGDNGRNFVNSKYGYDAVMSGLDAVIAQAVGNDA